MSTDLQVVYLARHGETAWSLTGQHAGLTDLPLTETGDRVAFRLGERLKGLNPAKVFSRQLQRAFRTCQLAGFGSVVEVDPDLAKWNFGEYEGRRTADIRLERPDWQLFRDGCPGGESPRQVSGSRRLWCDAGARHGGRRTAVLDRTLRSGFGCSLDRRRTDVARRSVHVEHGQLERFGLRTRPLSPVIRLWDDTKHVRSGGELKYESGRALKALG